MKKICFLIVCVITTSFNCIFIYSQSCTYTVPASFYVNNLSSGYNSYSCPSSGSYTGYLPQNEFVGGCVAGEMGGSFPTEAKNAQAVAARTYGLKRMNAGSGANCGQAYSFTVSSSCTTAANTTSNQVMLYNNSLIEALYSARCGGSYTHTAATTGCFTFSSLPYLVCVSCSGHITCSQAGETCTNCYNSCLGTTVGVYGHGVGMCQRGAQGFANQSWDYCQILNHFYTNICIANSSCSGTPEFLDCSSTITLSCGVPYNGTTVGGNSDVSSNNCNSWTDTGPERVHVITTTSTGDLTATLTNLGGVDLDVYILASCDMNDCHGTVTSNSCTYTNAPAGVYYIVVDGYNGASGSYTLTVNGNCGGSCADNFESNNNCTTATNVFGSPLGSGTSNYTPSGTNIGYAGDADWYKVQLQSCGTLTITLSNLPYDYDLQLYGGGCPGAQIAVSNNGGTASEQIVYTSTTTSLSPYYIYVYAYNGSDYSTSQCYNLNFQWSSSSGPGTVSITGNNTGCASTPITFTASATGATSYSWTAPAGWSPTTGSGSSFTTTPGSSGNITCTPSNSCGTGSQGTKYVTITSLPGTASIAGNSTGCSGTNMTFSASATNANNYNWTAPAGWSPTSYTGTSFITTPGSTGTITCTPTNDCGNGGQGTKNITIYTTPNQPTPTITSANPTCAGNTVNLQANTTATSYSWSGPNGYSSTSQNPSFTANSNSAGQYSLVVTQNGCQSAAGYTAYLSLNPSPSISFSPSSPNFCQGHGPVNVTAMGANSYTWTPSTGLSGTTISNPNANPSNTTTYTVTGNTSGCTGSSTVTVTVNPPASISVTPPSPSFCTGTSGVQLTASGGNSYIWSPTNGLSNANIANPMASPLSNTTYTVTGTNSNGCTGSTTVTVAVHTPPTINITPPNPSICAGGSIQLVASGAYTYTWTPSSGLSSTSGTTVTANPSSIGPHTYTVTGTDVYGCTNTTTVTVTVATTPSVTISANIQPPYCQGQTVILTPSTTGASYLWTPSNLTTGNISVTSTGTYTVAVTNPPGCTGTYTSAPFTVTINQNPTVPIITATTNPVCAGQAVSFSTTSPGPIYSWTGPNGFNYSVQNPPAINSVGMLNMGNYTLTVTNNEGCSSVSNIINLIVKDTNVNITGNTNVCSGQYDTLTATPGASYLWAPGGQITQIIYVNTSGTYTVTVTNPNSCNGTTKTASITVISSPSPPTPAISITNAGGGHINLVANPSTGYNFQWYLNMTGILQPIPGAIGNILFNADSCGYYLIRITDVISGCSSESGLIYCPVGINEIGNLGDFIIYPNPTNDQLNIIGDNLRNDNYEIILSNMIGQQLEKKTVKVSNHLLEYKFNIKDFSDGMYFLNIKSEKIYKTFRVEKL